MTRLNQNSTTRTVIRLLTVVWLSLLAVTAQAGVDITYIHNDALGSAVAGTDEQGAVKWRSQYEPYGEERLGERSAFGIRSGYTGHRDDPETGLTYMGARYYSPVIGRFMGVDPAGVNESNIFSFNRYAYANNNPYRFVDPNGDIAVNAVFEGFVIGSLFASTGCAITASCRDALVKNLSAIMHGLGNVFNEGEEGAEAVDGGKTGTIDDLLKDTVPIRTDKKSPKSDEVRDVNGGGLGGANKKFDGVRPRNVKDRGKGVRTGELDDGSIITVRPSSEPTISIVQPGKKQQTKIRF